MIVLRFVGVSAPHTRINEHKDLHYPCIEGRGTTTMDRVLNRVHSLRNRLGTTTRHGRNPASIFFSALGLVTSIVIASVAYVTEGGTLQ